MPDVFVDFHPSLAGRVPAFFFLFACSHVVVVEFALNLAMELDSERIEIYQTETENTKLCLMDASVK
jgi:hypothetical protein